MFSDFSTYDPGRAQDEWRATVGRQPATQDLAVKGAAGLQVGTLALWAVAPIDRRRHLAFALALDVLARTDGAPDLAGLAAASLPVASAATVPLLLPSSVLPFAAPAADRPLAPAPPPPPPQPDIEAATETATRLRRKTWHLQDMGAPREK